MVNVSQSFLWQPGYLALNWRGALTSVRRDAEGGEGVCYLESLLQAAALGYLGHFNALEFTSCPV